MIYDVLLLMLCTFSKGLFLNSCTFFKGLFVLFCHFFKGLSVAKIQNFLLKGKEDGNYFLLKWKVFLSLQLFLYFCNKIFKIGVPDSRGMLYYERQLKAGIPTTEITFDPVPLGIKGADFWEELNKEKTD